MLYTRRGDDGTTEAFDGKAISALGRRISKSSIVAEALGAIDEANSFLGLARARTNGKSFEIGKKKINFARSFSLSYCDRIRIRRDKYIYSL